MGLLPSDGPSPIGNGNGTAGSAVGGRSDLDRSRTPVHLEYVADCRIVIARFCGSFDTDGAWQGLETIANEVSCRVVEGVLLDIRDSTYTPLTTDARAFAAYLISFLGRRRLAFITRSVVQYGMARMIAEDAALHGVSVKVFQDKQQGDTWLRSTDRR